MLLTCRLNYSCLTCNSFALCKLGLYHVSCAYLLNYTKYIASIKENTVWYMHAQNKSRIFGCVHIKCANYIAELTVSPFPPLPPTYAGFLVTVNRVTTKQPH